MKIKLILFLFFFTGHSCFSQGWSLVWEENFSGTTLDQSVWTQELGTGSQYGLWGWGNSEQQFYQADNSEISGGTLKIIAKEEPAGIVDSWGNLSYYSSSRMITRDKFEFKYGKVEARIKTVNGEGFWPAFWMLPSGGSWPCDGEIDIMEQWGNDWPTNITTGAAHIGSCPGSSTYLSHQYQSQNGNYADDFHLYSVIWQEDYIAWYVDNIKVYQISPTSYSSIPSQHSWPFNDNDWYLILNLAITQSGPNSLTVFPAQIEVDYIKIYENTGVLGCNDPQALNYNPSATVSNGSCEYQVTFKVDMNNVSASFSVPEVNGTFNSWCGNCWPMEDLDGDNIWETQVTMIEGSYELKFSADNWSISENLDPTWGCTNGNTQYTNRTLLINENKVICPEWGLCTPTCNPVIISSVDENNNNNAILYPNPSTGLFYLKGSNINNLKINDLLGNTVFEKNQINKGEEINLKHLPNGLYIYEYGKNRISSKLQIIK